MEKINVYVPKEIENKLRSDADLFEIQKKDGISINMNKFLGRVIKGYYEEYERETNDKRCSIMKAISTDKISQNEKEQIVNTLVESLIYPSIPSRKGKNPKRLSVKPTEDTLALFENIDSDIIKGKDYISQYFCRLFVSYCEKPFSKREQIVFKEEYSKILEACKTKRCLKIDTKWTPGKFHYVTPYTVAVGPEDMFNYLLCAEKNKDSGEQETRSFRLNRIRGIYSASDEYYINDSTKNHLELMLKNGPAYMINSDEEICVRLTREGLDNYRKIYFGRPKAYQPIEEKDGYYYMRFIGSEEQVFYYFRRFDGTQAVIVSPLSLKEKMLEHHHKSFEAYEHEI